jgi:hypothetical protein
MEFDGVGTGSSGGADLFEVGINEEADGDAGLAEASDGFGERRAGDVEAAFGGDFGAFFGDETHFVGADAFGDGDDFRDVGHFEV